MKFKHCVERVLKRLHSFKTWSVGWVIWSQEGLKTWCSPITWKTLMHWLLKGTVNTKYYWLLFNYTDGAKMIHKLLFIWTHENSMLFIFSTVQLCVYTAVNNMKDSDCWYVECHLCGHRLSQWDISLKKDLKNSSATPTSCSKYCSLYLPCTNSTVHISLTSKEKGSLCDMVQVD